MHKSDIDRIREILERNGTTIAPGLSDEEINRIESGAGITFPDDYKQLLMAMLPIGSVPPPQGQRGGGSFPDWRNNGVKEIESTRAFIKRTFSFDIENNDLWLEHFGEKPENLKEAVEQATAVLDKLPILLPVFSHRFIPSSPTSSGNPIFSLPQPSDTILYGSNLLRYFEAEFENKHETIDYDNVKTIPFWSNLLELD